jgi:hypothetical protein
VKKNAMMALGCDLRIVEAIDLGMEWRLDWTARHMFAARDASDCAEAWYDGLLGGPSTAERLGGLGTYSWPPSGGRRYAIKR